MKRAIAIARACGFRGEDVRDVAEEIRHEWSQSGLSRRRLAARVCRKHLAERLGIPRRELPSDLLSLAAIAAYENQRESYREAMMTPSFDYHDREFARNNLVCPRCSSSAGTFIEARGNCPCGFSY